ncbi:MAG TPA: YebC/PmpR family DNA-binding transcriptional regulator [Patescibacteria group bacterium]|jgi:YebC/PmpR family DNA-binding regulatory protein|nr:YebC/PmpR family DNA-binding transcriptional regulator [Patescibacteria group bacterium]
MSGHSKWAQIKRQKGVNDQKRGKTFTKLANAITIAVKQGGGIGDPASNFRLRLAIDAARASNMPKENIERAIKRASGKDAGEITEVTYEGFAPGGVSVIVEAATDNAMRTTSEVKSIFNKAGASFGQPGSVSYQFKHVGRIIVQKESKSFDDIFAIAADLGAEDIEEVGNEVFVYTPLQDLAKIKDALAAAGVTVGEAELIREPITTVKVEEQDKLTKIENFVNSLEELDDVQKVYTNLQ